MRNLNQAPAESASAMPMNHFLVAKTGQLSLMPTVGFEAPAPEPSLATEPVAVEPAIEQAA